MTEEESKTISQLIERLVVRFPHIPAETVFDTVGEFKHASVRDFVPLLVEHDVLTSLKKIAGHSDPARASQQTEGPELALGRHP